MTTLRGRLRSTGSREFAGWRVLAEYERRATLADGESAAEGNAEELWVPAAGTVFCEPEGSFAIELGEDGEWRAPVTLRAIAPDGARVAVAEIAQEEVGRKVTLDVGAVTPASVEPSDDPTLGSSVRLTGRVIDAKGEPAPAGLMVVIWGVRPGRAEADAYPLVVSSTASGGYFSEPWPADRLGSAWARVMGGGAVPIALEDERLPRSVIVVLDDLPEPAAPHDHDDCDCEPAPPRAPDELDLVTNSGEFSADLGGQCVDVTVPNRVLEEFQFQAVVRTSEPSIRGVRLDDDMPELVKGRLVDLAAEAAPRRAAPVSKLRMAPGALAATVRNEGALTPERLREVGVASARDRLTKLIRLIDSDGPGRVTLDARNQIDWDDTPTTYQATQIAHGHLLTFKQVWRADGYSLGDLLYSLPLAPGQKKQVAIVDWERQETATRVGLRQAIESVAAELSHDRDISDIVSSSLQETQRGRSEAGTQSVAAGIGGFIGPIVFGVAGGYSHASSSAWQRSSRDVAASALNQVRDRTMQSASSVRSQRTTVVQAARQGESLRAQSEVVANYNHCHALTVEYFEVLRHLQVSTELAAVRECLFVPLDVSDFTPDKALSWRTALERHLRRRALRPAFDALDRVRSNWQRADTPAGRYADEQLIDLVGDLELELTLPRPADREDHTYDAASWAPYAAYLSRPTQDIWRDQLAFAAPAERDGIWNRRIAPRIASRLVNALTVHLELADGTSASVDVDATLVSSFRQDTPLSVGVRPLTIPPVSRADVTAVRIGLPATLPDRARAMVVRGGMDYRTDHIAHHLFRDYRLMNDLGAGSDDALVPTPLTHHEKRNPREEDRRLADNLVAHLNDHVEYYHEAIWLNMDPNRRYLLLDGHVAPNSGGRSVASCVENRVIGVVGNCLVMPVVPGLRLDPGYKLEGREEGAPIDLRHAYVTDPPPPIRVSVPTKGVFAEAIQGACNSCEVKDDTRFWRWEESPIPEAPTAILPISTESRRRTPPDLSPDQLPTPLVRMQNAPAAPDPTGLAAAMELIGTPNLFRDLTGIDLNQQNAAQAFRSAMDTAKFFAGEGAKLAQAQYLQREMDRTLKRIEDARNRGLITNDQARELSESAITGANGGRRRTQQTPTANPSVQRAMERVSRSESGELAVHRPGGSVEVRSGDRDAGEPYDFRVDPSVTPIAQGRPELCWAAAGAMLLSWRDRVALTVEAAADRAGPEWRRRVDEGCAITQSEIPAYTAAIGLRGEPPMSYTPRGLLRLLQSHGPLWAIGDDSIANDRMSHVRIVTGIRRGARDADAIVRVVDPNGPTTEEIPFADFARNLEAQDPVRLGLGIYHF